MASFRSAMSQSAKPQSGYANGSVKPGTFSSDDLPGSPSSRTLRVIGRLQVSLRWDRLCR